MRLGTAALPCPRSALSRLRTQNNTVTKLIPIFYFSYHFSYSFPGTGMVRSNSFSVINHLSIRCFLPAGTCTDPQHVSILLSVSVSCANSGFLQTPECLLPCQGKGKNTDSRRRYDEPVVLPPPRGIMKFGWVSFLGFVLFSFLSLRSPKMLGSPSPRWGPPAGQAPEEQRFRTRDVTSTKCTRFPLFTDTQQSFKFQVLSKRRRFGE